MFVSVLTAVTAVHAGSVIIAASVFPDWPPSDQTSGPSSDPEIKHTKRTIGAYTTLVAAPFGCEWFGMQFFLQEEKR